jgi:hypothetical protein
MRRAVAVVLALTAGGCSYDFNNPAEKLGMGQALGRVVVDRGAGREPLDGTLVTLENSFSFNQVTRSTGRFTLLSLPMGRHRVLFRKGSQFAGERIVEIVAGDDGKPEGVNLGDVRLRSTVTVQGTLALPAGFSSFDYSRLVYDVTDEVSGQPAALTSAPGGGIGYSFRGLAVGEHRFRFAVAGDFDPLGTGTGTRQGFGAPPLVVTIPDTSEGQQLTMNALPLVPEVASTVAGSIRLRIQAVGSGGSGAPSGTSVDLFDAVTFDPLGLNTPVDSLTPDSGGWVQADELPGLYVLRINPPPPITGGAAPGGEVFFDPPPPIQVLIRSSSWTELGTLYLVNSFTGSDAAFACFADSECQGVPCVDLKCQGGSPVPPVQVAPFTMPYCILGDSSCLSTPGMPCGLGGRGICLIDCTGVKSGNMGVNTCYPDATTQRCTPDGVQTSTGTFSQFCP